MTRIPRIKIGETGLSLWSAATCRRFSRWPDLSSSHSPREARQKKFGGDKSPRGGGVRRDQTITPSYVLETGHVVSSAATGESWILPVIARFSPVSSL